MAVFDDVVALLNVVLSILADINVIAHCAGIVGATAARSDGVSRSWNNRSSKGCGESQSVNELAFHGVFPLRGNVFSSMHVSSRFGSVCSVTEMSAAA